MEADTERTDFPTELSLEELYRLIGLQPEVVRTLEGLKMPRLGALGVRLMDGETAADAYRELEQALREDQGHFRMLLCQLECARRLAERYREKGLPWKIFADTMKCFSRFLEECGRKNGKLFFDRGWWTYRQISMRLFRIGSLEYELAEWEDGPGKQEKVPAVSIHIPSDADLSRDAVTASLRQARAFFRSYEKKYADCIYFCHSWLLSPALRPLLAADSHILSFQDRFTLVSVHEEGTDFLEWLYQVPADTGVEELPEKTSLQRGVKKLLLEGGSVGEALGILDKGD